jgi:hypothetical protein
MAFREFPQSAVLLGKRADAEVTKRSPWKAGTTLTLSFIAKLFVTCGVVCIYLFATGATVGEGLKGVSFVERALAPFRQMTLVSGMLLSTSVVAFFLAVAFRQKEHGPARDRDGVSWDTLLQIAFTTNVALVAAVLLLLFVSVTGYLPGPPPGPATTGALFLIAVAEAILGTMLGIALLFMRRSSIHYVSSVLIHAAEVGILAVVFFLGSSA